MSAPWQALILAGGRSSRMGRDKAALPWQGKQLLDHLVSVLTGAGAAAVHIAGRQPDGRGIADRWPDRGPLGGLASALPQIDDGPLLVLPVDLPRIDASALWPLWDAPAGQAVRYRDEALPLRLQVDEGLRETVEQLVREPARQRSLHSLFARCAGSEISLPAALRPLLLNCNTPDDWRRALAASAAPTDADADLALPPVVHQPER